MNKIRIRKHDSNNWVIEQYDPGGADITIGKRKGEKTKPSWKITAYYAQLKHAAARCVDEALGDQLDVTGREILDRIEEAEKAAIAAAEGALSR